MVIISAFDEIVSSDGRHLPDGAEEVVVVKPSFLLIFLTGVNCGKRNLLICYAMYLFVIGCFEKNYIVILFEGKLFPFL